MITDFLLEHSGLVPLALVCVALACAALGFCVAARVRAAWVLAGLAVLPVLGLTLVPTGRAQVFERCTVQWSWPGLGTVELLANVALFIPPVLLGAVASRRPAFAFAAGTALSALLEGVQALVTPIGRSCDTNDWAMNTLGAAVGALLAAVVLAVATRRPG